MSVKTRICYGCMNRVEDGEPCPICGKDVNEQNPENLLQHGHLLANRYIIGSVIESNGEGATYIAFDREKKAVVRVHEFFPTGLCTRHENGTVLVNDADSYTYNSCLMKFIELHKSLTKLCDNPALLTIENIFETGSTAYTVTENIPAVTLREFLIKNGGVLSWEQVRTLFVPIMSALSDMHAEGILHRGISPDTLLVGNDGKMRISGICIPEERTADSCMTSQLFPGFAAIEQYGKAGDEGESTDVYGLCAVIYRAVVGNPPPEALQRLEEDRMTIPSKLVKELPQSALEMLAGGLQFLPEDRTPDIAQIKNVMSLGGDNKKHKQEAKHEPRSNDKKKKSGNAKYAIISAVITVVILIGMVVAIWLVTNGNNEKEEKVSSKVEVNTSSSSEESSLEPVDNTKYYEVPNLAGLTYKDIVGNENYTDYFKIILKAKEYSSSVQKGQVVSQSPAAGQKVAKDTEIAIVVSLGSAEVNIPNVIGLDPDKAIIELMRAGFAYENIEISERYDENAQPGVIINATPSSGKVNVDSIIKMDVNSYKGEEYSGDAQNSSTQGTTSENSGSQEQ